MVPLLCLCYRCHKGIHTEIQNLSNIQEYIIYPSYALSNCEICSSLAKISPQNSQNESKGKKKKSKHLVTLYNIGHLVGKREFQTLTKSKD